MVSPAFAGEEKGGCDSGVRLNSESWMNAKAVDAKRVAGLVQVGELFGGIDEQAGRGPWWLTFRH